MNILITGADGMLGRTLQKQLTGHSLYTPAYPEFDITTSDSVKKAFDAASPEVVIHCAAMTQVDDCEQERDLAFAVNEGGTRNIAALCGESTAQLIAISTDYVFDGLSPEPYAESDRPNPQTVYGQSKLAGERAIQEHCDHSSILRTAWLYGSGGPSFVHTMVKLGTQEGNPLKVVDDQVGNPTSCNALAGVILEMIERPARGIFHCTCEGEATWYEFAQEIFARRGLKRPIQPCTTAEFPRPAARPANSRLDNRALRENGFSPLPNWKQALTDFLGSEEFTP